MSVDLTIPGDPAAIRQVAEWLAPQVDDAGTEAWLELNYLWADSSSYWTGEAGDAFRAAAAGINRKSTPISGYLKRAADVFLAYANRLERGQEDFDSLLSQANAAGLVCVRRSRIVLAPATSLDYCPTDEAPAADVEEYDRYLSALTVYNSLSTTVGTWWGELEAWLVEHMLPLVEQVEEFVPLSDSFEALTLGNEDVVQAALTAAEHRVNRSYEQWGELYAAMQADAEKYTKGLRSGNPALKAASEAANPRAIRQGMEELGEVLGTASRAGKVIPGIGIVIDVVTGVIAISEGDSATGVGAEILGGMGGGAAGAGAGTLIAGAVGSNPLGWVIGGAIVLGVAGSYAGRWAWEASVPLNVRETIDDFFVGAPPVLENTATGGWAVGAK